MSFESAQQILQMYYQSEQQRISGAMELAYNEALTRYKSESAAREAAVQVLAEEEKSWRAYQKELAAIRREQMKGNIQMAKINSEIAFYNKKEQARVDDTNRMRKYQKGVEGAKIRAMAGDKMQQDIMKVEKAANTYAEQQTTGETLFNNELQNVASELITLLNDPNMTPSNFAVGEKDLYTTAFAGQDKLHSGLDRARSDSKILKSDPTFTQATPQEDLEDIRLSDLGMKFLAHVSAGTGRPSTDPYIRQLSKYIFDGVDTDPQSGSGRLKDVKSIDMFQKQQAYDTEYQAYYDAYKPLEKDTRPPVIRGEPPMKKAVLKEEIKPIDYGGQELARQAKEVFDALSARDDTPFEIDAEERESISQQAFDAYEELKRVVPKDPLAVTFEERTLLDDAALERQLSILKQRQAISKMSPYMASPEVIRARAGELLEPSAKKPQINIPASAQRYYATEQDAFKMSDRSDIDIQNMGVPEQAGVSLYKEMFDQTQGALKDNQSYDQVLDRINDFFPDDKQKQLRAITAFNSRAMALQRSRNPLVLRDGSQNIDYLEALKALGK